MRTFSENSAISADRLKTNWDYVIYHWISSIRFDSGQFKVNCERYTLTKLIGFRSFLTNALGISKSANCNLMELSEDKLDLDINLFYLGYLKILWSVLILILKESKIM